MILFDIGQRPSNQILNVIATLPAYIQHQLEIYLSKVFDYLKYIYYLIRLSIYRIRQLLNLLYLLFSLLAQLKCLGL